MNEGLFLQERFPWFLATWVLASAWGHQVAVYRAFVDRIRAGASTAAEEDLRKNKRVTRLLDDPDDLRPWSMESATLSATQVALGSLGLYGLAREVTMALGPEWGLGAAVAAFLLALFSERVLTGILAPMVAARPIADAHMKAAWPAMLLIRKLCVPLRSLLGLKERALESLIGKEEETGEAEEEVAEHIRTLQEEGSELEPEIREIVGNTLELRNLDVQDALMPRNQVQFLDANDSLEENLALARSGGHTRLPLCDGDLDRCLGIVHVKDLFGRLAEGKSLNLRDVARPTLFLFPGDSLPVALRRMLRQRAHMALVRDEFGGTDGILTLEDVLEEVVGEIRDEFDSEEETIIENGDGSWNVSGMAHAHELPECFYLEETDEAMATFGGLVTAELGRIPETGETVRVASLEVKILEADDSRVIRATVRIASEQAEG